MEGRLRRDIQNTAGLIFRQAVVDKQLAQVEHRLQVDVHHAIPLLLGDFSDVTAQPDPGVIDQNIGVPQAFETGREQILPAMLVGKIGFHRNNFDAGATFYRSDQLFRALLITHIGEADVDPFSGE